MQSRSLFECASRAVANWDKVARAVASSRIIFIGETHHQSDVVAFQKAVVEEAAKALRSPAAASARSALHVVFEHFAVDQQPSLNSYFEGRSSWEGLLSDYSKGAEGFDLHVYKPVLDYLLHEKKENAIDIHVHGGFIPRGRARDYASPASHKSTLLEKDMESGFLTPEALHLKPSLLSASLLGLGEAVAPVLLKADAEEGEVAGSPLALHASHAHKSFFLSLLSGVDLPLNQEEATAAFEGASPSSPIDPRQPSRILPAQVIKDLSAASIVAKALSSATSPSSSSKVVVLCGKGHCDYGFGIPERALAIYHRMMMLREEKESKRGEEDSPSTLVLSCRDSREDVRTWHYSYFSDGTRRLPAHFVFPFAADPEEEEEEEQEGATHAVAAGAGGSAK
jgi:Haem-binding uptake, Tiki superfamily, ChaN